MRDLGTLPGATDSNAWAVNARGDIVGDSGGRAFLWQAGMGMRAVDPPGSGNIASQARAINDHGQVAGTVYKPNGQTRAFLWQVEMGMQELPTQGYGSFAYALNDRGQVVGTDAEPSNTAVLWQPTDLPPPVITPSVSGMQGTNGWYRGDVTVSWSVTDPESGIASTSGCSTTKLTTDTPGTTLTCTATNGLTLSASQSVTVKLDKTSPVTKAVPSPAPNGAGWNTTSVSVTLTATDSLAGIARTEYNLAGGGWTAYAAPVTVAAEGIHALQYRSIDQAGNVEAAHQLTIKIDKTPPIVTCQANPRMLWPPNGKLVPVQVSVSVTDPTRSGPNGYKLVSMTSNEGSPGDEQQGFVVGAASPSGLLQAARAGKGSGRVYALTYQGSDVAGNTATCTTTVKVPHDQRH
jgi:probable HAF family extracellular repeat protein